MIVAIIAQQALSETTDWATVFREFAAAERVQHNKKSRTKGNNWLEATKNFPSVQYHQILLENSSAEKK